VSTKTGRKSENIELLDSLPNSFVLHDGEYVYGEWSEDVEFLYTLSDDTSVPLATRQKCGKGTIFWVNTGDHTDKGPPTSLSNPADEFVEMVSNMVFYTQIPRSSRKSG
jgi:hypothetical protein